MQGQGLATANGSSVPPPPPPTEVKQDGEASDDASANGNAIAGGERELSEALDAVDLASSPLAKVGGECDVWGLGASALYGFKVYSIVVSRVLLGSVVRWWRWW